LFGAALVNTLLAMSEYNEVLSQKRPIERRAAPSGVSAPAMAAKVPYGGDAAEVPIVFILVRTAAILLIAALVIARLIVAFGVEEFKAHWPRGRMPHIE
jgi:hypothetical protein